MKVCRSMTWGILALGLLVVTTPAVADDLSGADRLICSSVQATVCAEDGECEIGPPWNWNIPNFIVIDLKKGELSTTPASGERRVTPFKNHESTQGVTYIQGVESGRAFSLVINQATGQLSVAVAREGVTVSVFGACTPQGG